MQKEIPIKYSDGLYDNSDQINIPTGALLPSSNNVIYNRSRKLTSLLDAATFLSSKGASKVFVLDDDLLGLLGVDNTTGKGRGSMLQSTGKSLWFVGNSVSNGAKILIPSTGTQTTIGDLSSIPQFAKYTGSGWGTPVQVGLSEQEDLPELILTSDDTRGSDFAGINTGSFSARLAKKRDGHISIASAPSNIVTADEDSMYVTIPAMDVDGSSEWVLYFTYAGFGSQYQHKMFPMFIPEDELDGTTSPTLHTKGNAKYKVVSQHASDQSQRKLEVEFNDNDLLLLEPFDDNFAADSCKFMAQLGNIMCLIGTGTGNTGLDLSKAGDFEAYSPDDRQWFSEEPLAVSHNPEYGFTWVAGKHTINQLRWTGAQDEPITMQTKTSIYGVIGENAMCSINGVLFFMSAGKTPIMITPDGELNKEIGTPIKNAFSSYDSTTVVVYDEDTNSVLFICGQVCYALQLDYLSEKVWSAKGTIAGALANIDCAFSYNGHTYLCTYFHAVYSTYIYNSSGDLNWNADSTFQSGDTLSLKDIINIRLLAESPSQPYTITAYLAKNFGTSYTSVATLSGAATGITIGVETRLERLDYETVSLRVSGTKGGQTIHFSNLVADIHSIERR